MVDQEELYKFKKMLKKLRKYRGSGTQLVSVYIPANYPIPDIAAKIREEINQASNIKSKQTRTNVIDALERISAALKSFKKTPPKGLVIFSGNVSTDPSKQDIQTFVLEPLYTLKRSVYKCDSQFYLEPLEQMVENKNSYGIVVMDGKEATIALLKGTEIIILKKLNNTAPPKARKGGQSARRYERIIEEATDHFYKRIGEAMDQFFLNKVNGIIIGGPGPAKEFFLKEKPFNYQHKIIGVVNTGYTDTYGVKETIANAKDLLKEQEVIKERTLVEQFIREVAKKGKVVYGIKPVLDVIKANRAGKVLISENIGLSIGFYKCSDGTEFYKINKNLEDQIKKDNKDCSLYDEEDFIDYVIEECRDRGIDVEIISNNTDEGKQFFLAFKGIGAFLRY